MGDLPLQRMIQLEIPPAQLGKVFSLRTVTGEAGYMLGLLMAPALFATLPVRATIALAAAVTVASGVIGLVGIGWRAVPS